MVNDIIIKKQCEREEEEEGGGGEEKRARGGRGMDEGRREGEVKKGRGRKVFELLSCICSSGRETERRGRYGELLKKR